MIKRPYILHPFFFAAFPVVSVYATNAVHVRADAVLRPLIVSLAAVGLLVLLFRLICGKWRRAALAASLINLLFFSFGHVNFFLLTRSPTSIWSNVVLLLAVYAVVMIVGVWALLRLLRKTIKLTIILNTISSALVAGILLLLVWNIGLSRGEVSWKKPPLLDPKPGPSWDGTRPDIYYIILDAYGSQEALREFYGVDNQLFLDGLRQRGFVVADGSATNYWKTRFSLASSLNFHYTSDLVAVPREETRDFVLPHLVTNSAVQRFLEAQGYQTVAFATDYNFSDIRSADVYFGARKPLTQFEMNLLTGTMAIFWVDQKLPGYHRQDVLQHFADLEQAASLEGPKFVFAHIIIPHQPFVFAADGSPSSSGGSADADEYAGGREKYISGYAGQVRYANLLVEHAVDTILANSSTPPVIILQGDHGPGAYLDRREVDKSCMRERFPILNAYYLPGQEQAATAIPKDISPVNTFRVIFNAYFDTRLPLEPNRHYAVPDPYMFDLLEVTDRLNECPIMDGPMEESTGATP